MRKNRVTFRPSPDKLLGNESSFSNEFVSYMRPLLNSSTTYWNEMPSPKRNGIVDNLLKQSFALFKAGSALRKIL